MWLTVREGAILVLPPGGSREDLISTSRLTDYINKHALDWYQHLCQHSKSGAKMIPNGSSYLITGCDKAKSWSAVAFPSEWRDAGERVEMTYEEGEFPRWLPFKWAREKGLGRDEGKNRNYCIFVRGIHISLSNRLWVRHLPVSPLGLKSYYNILSSSVMGLELGLRASESAFSVGQTRFCLVIRRSCTRPFSIHLLLTRFAQLVSFPSIYFDSSASARAGNSFISIYVPTF